MAGKKRALLCDVVDAAGVGLREAHPALCPVPKTALGGVVSAAHGVHVLRRLDLQHLLVASVLLDDPRVGLDAARANEFYIYRRIVLPFAKPAFAAGILFQTIYCWNDYIGPLVYINNQVWYPLSLGLYLILGTYTTNWPWVMAAATAATAPIVVLFFFTQRTFIKGIAIQGTGVKG